MRKIVSKILMIIFNLSLTVFIIMGLVLVLIQVGAMVIANGSLSVGISSMLLKPTVAFSAATGLAGWLYSYVAKKET